MKRILEQVVTQFCMRDKIKEVHKGDAFMLDDIMREHQWL